MMRAAFSTGKNLSRYDGALINRCTTRSNSAISRFNVSSNNSTHAISKQPTTIHHYQKRMMGGDSHLPKPQSEDAVMFGGHSTHPEGWETSVHIGYATSLVLCIAILFFAPETGIDNWANQEARARLKLKEEHGWTNDMFQFGVHYQNLNEEEAKSQWDKFSNKAVKMNEDDDDDDEEEEEDEDEDEEE